MHYNGFELVLRLETSSLLADVFIWVYYQDEYHFLSPFRSHRRWIQLLIIDNVLTIFFFAIQLWKNSIVKQLLCRGVNCQHISHNMIFGDYIKNFTNLEEVFCVVINFNTAEEREKIYFIMNWSNFFTMNANGNLRILRWTD